MADAVEDGVLAPGAALPSQLELAEKLGVSARVPREAFRRLAAQGVAVARPRLGCVVLPRRRSASRGRILFVLREPAGYHSMVMENVLRSRLTEAGYLFAKAGIRHPHGSRHEYDELDAALSHPVALCIVCDDESELFARIRSHGVDIAGVTILPHRREPGVQYIRLDPSGAIPQLVQHCRAARIRSVVQFSLGTWVDAADMLEAAGIRVERVVLEPDLSSCPQLNAQRAGMEAMLSRFGDSARRSLPDLFVFTDDYVAEGALTALGYLGIRVPDDVRVVTSSISGKGPVYPVSLTRMELDPYDNARRIGKWVRLILADRPLPADAVIRPRYIRGKTFA